MGLLSWLTHLAGGKDVTYEEHKAKTGSAESHTDEEASKYGLNFMQVIEAHQRWKKRLQDYISNKSAEHLRHEDVGCDDKCMLGIWIYSSGKEAFKGSPLYEDMKHTHTQFHSIAGEVVKLKESGDTNAAKELLESGLYTQLSGKLQSQLAKLYMGDK